MEQSYAAVFACTPHPGFGTVAIERRALVEVVDLSTCRIRTERRPRAARPEVVVATARRGKTGRQSIVFRGRVVLTIRESYARVPGGVPGPIEVFGTTPDRRWILYAIDPMSSSSIAADGLTLKAVPVAGGRPRTVAFGLLYADYRAWCGGKLVITAGGDRIATNRKRLLVTAAPAWNARRLVRAPRRSFGSLACAPDGRSVVAQSQAQSDDANFFHTHWALWRVGLDGSLRQLTHPPPGCADESPRFSPDGRTLYFVRSRNGRGRLYALRRGRVVGPLLSLGYSLGYYGHQAWSYAVRS